MEMQIAGARSFCNFKHFDALFIFLSCATEHLKIYPLDLHLL